MSRNRRARPGPGSATFGRPGPGSPAPLAPKQAYNDGRSRGGAGRRLEARTAPTAVCDGCVALGCSFVMLDSRTCWRRRWRHLGRSTCSGNGGPPTRCPRPRQEGSQRLAPWVHRGSATRGNAIDLVSCLGSPLLFMFFSSNPRYNAVGSTGVWNDRIRFATTSPRVAYGA